MTPTEIVRKLLSDTRMTQVELAKATDYASQGTIQNILKRNNMNVDTFDKIMAAFGYEIVVRPVGSKDREKEIIVTVEK